MIEKFCAKLIIKKTCSFLFLACFIFVFPTPSYLFLGISLVIILIAIICMIYLIKKTRSDIYFAYYICPFILFSLVGFHCLDYLMGMSFKLLLGLIPGIFGAVIFPFIDKKQSERLYIDQSLSSINSCLRLLVFALINLMTPLLIWDLLGFPLLKKAILPVVFIGIFPLIVLLFALQSGIHMHISNIFLDRLNNRN